jgi:lipopolysaccharide/colanic/teichoic acid biosynthesis glycosyltransferase
MKQKSLPCPKRIFDIIFSFIALVVLIPLFCVIAAVIKLSSKGPVFFKQERIGKNGIPFTLLKFRSMTVMKEASDGLFEPGNVSRVTTVGKFLRKSKLDELPQLFNVLFGEMSLVGPRPEVKKWVSAYPDRWMKVLTVSPGMTDNASIEFRNEEKLLTQSEHPEKTYLEQVLPQKLTVYEHYVDNHSLTGDLKLIFKTVFYCVFK